MKPIMFDVDGVLCDFVLGFTTLANKLFPEVPITGTHNQPSWTGFPNMTQDQINATWQQATETRGFLEGLRPLWKPEEKEAIHRDLLGIEDGHDLYFVTSRHGKYAKDETENWIRKTFFGIHPTVILCKNKGEFAKAVGCGYSIEDKASNASCIDWLTHGKTKSYLLDRPYNRLAPEYLASGVIRINSLQDYLDIILKGDRDGKGEV